MHKRLALVTIFSLLTGLAAHADPLADLDRDGVPDHIDYCPNNSFEELSRGVHSDGCPMHSDRDNIPDYRDRCPDTPKGVKTNASGCPINVNLHVYNRIINSRSLINIH